MAVSGEEVTHAHKTAGGLLNFASHQFTDVTGASHVGAKIALNMLKVHGCYSVEL